MNQLPFDLQELLNRYRSVSDKKHWIKAEELKSDPNESLSSVREKLKRFKYFGFTVYTDKNDGFRIFIPASRFTPQIPQPSSEENDDSPIQIKFNKPKPENEVFEKKIAEEGVEDEGIDL